MNPRLLRILAILAVAALLAAAGIAFTVLRPLPVQVAQARSNVPIEVFGLGTIEARVVSRIGFEVSNTLVELTADQGDRLAAGTVLARLHAEEQQARVAKAQAVRAQAEANLAQAGARVQRAAAVLAQRQQTNRRQQTLARRGTVAVEDAEAAQLAADVAAADLTVARSETRLAEAGARDAGAALELEQVMLAHHTLRAPYEALVLTRHRELGTVLAPGEPVFTLIDPDTIWALAFVDEARAGGIRLGQPARVRLRSLPRERFSGRVVRIDIESDRVSEERRVYVRCDDCPPDLHLGEQVEVVIGTGVLERALLVPETAIDAFDGTSGRVWTVEDGRLAQRRVEFGERTLDGEVAVSAGLPAGASVLVALPAGLREGRAARVNGAAR